MGDTRYDRAWADVFDTAAPEDRARLLAHIPLAELVQMLGAKQAASHPLERNVVATALLNRLPHGGVGGLSRREIEDRIRDTQRLVVETRSTAKATRESVDEQRTNGHHVPRQGRKA